MTHYPFFFTNPTRRRVQKSFTCVEMPARWARRACRTVVFFVFHGTCPRSSLVTAPRARMYVCIRGVGIHGESVTLTITAMKSYIAQWAYRRRYIECITDCESRWAIRERVNFFGRRDRACRIARVHGRAKFVHCVVVGWVVGCVCVCACGVWRGIRFN